MKWMDHFRMPVVADLVAAELRELELLRYKEDQRRDHHAALVEGYTLRINKLRAQSKGHNTEGKRPAQGTDAGPV
jgi:hypothetical protein